MKDRYELVASSELQKRTCLSYFGNSFSTLYLVVQMVFVLLIGVALTHETIALFNVREWQFMVGLLILNLVVAIVLKCAYNSNYAYWERFRKTLLVLILVQLCVHAGVPIACYVLKTNATDEYDKAVYDSRMLFFGALGIVDGILFLLMAVPYYFLYEINDDKGKLTKKRLHKD
eukprot:TRINITY_DN2988_c0_g3_i1.p1 TRINITY_DN2988_c0_g3~~TRINITY_DN2988_c0_g3_i1.p1  ORF type:complete len:174 (+),score=19.73 TRINITY_DN2988_c0_g3_i1:113-634(+)